MAKTKEELNKIKNEVESVNNKLHELTPEELEQVTGGSNRPHPPIGAPFDHDKTTLKAIITKHYAKRQEVEKEPTGGGNITIG